jgi:hypothetical protein
MAVQTGWSKVPYDPLRAVNGELDNVFSPIKTPLKVDFKK